MIFVLPVGHERDRLRRPPWVSISIGSLCLLVFLLGLGFRARALREARDLAAMAFAYAAERPYLVLDEDLLFEETDLQREAGDGRRGSLHDEPRREDRVAEEQARLDALTREWRRARERDPLRVLGLVPARGDGTALVTHIFVHVGWLHLLGNLFFLWLVGPPLEDVWGRWIFALFFLASGVAAGMGWVARYPNSEIEVVGASGAIAGLMGGFLVRFWGTRIRFVYALMPTPRIRVGAFWAPAWIMLALWLGRELAFASLMEPHVTPGEGVASWAHVFGFAFGVVAAAGIRISGIEERWVRPRIGAKLGELDNPVVERAAAQRQAGRLGSAWRTLAARAAEAPGDRDAVLAWWDLALEMGREAEAAPCVRALLRDLARGGEGEVALACWKELERAAAAPDPPPPDLLLALAEGLLDVPELHSEARDLLARARGGLADGSPPGSWLRLARIGSALGAPGNEALCRRLAERRDLPPEVRREMRSLGRGAILTASRHEDRSRPGETER